MAITNFPGQTIMYILVDIDEGIVIDEFRTASKFPAREAKKHWSNFVPRDGSPTNYRIFIMLGGQEDYK